jgi:pyruvate, orthophosphate dikinase
VIPSRLGLPVPSGCIITTETCVDYFKLNHTESEIDYFIEDKKIPDHLEEGYLAAIRKIEIETGKKYGTVIDDGKPPLLLAIRAGAAVSIPGMDSVLNVGINDRIVELIVQRSDGYQRFALDLYRRFLQMFGHLVMKVDQSEYQKLLNEALAKDGVQSDELLSRESLKFLVDEYKKLAPIPQDPYVQLQMTIEAIFCSWNTKRFCPCLAFFFSHQLSSLCLFPGLSLSHTSTLSLSLSLLLLSEPRDSVKECKSPMILGQQSSSR